jgi:MFS family permease
LSPGNAENRQSRLPDPVPVSNRSPIRRRRRALRAGAIFSSLRTRNFRLFATGQIFSNTGSWVQRIAQDWLVLSLTGSAAAVGVTTALQFLPTLLFGLVGGLIADRFPKRKILLLTQVGMSTVAGVLALLTLAHWVAAWHVFLLAFALGVVTAVDNPTRQSFVNEMVGPEQLRNAISINSSVFQLGGLVGPAISGILISAVGPGYLFALNAVSYVAPFVALTRMRESELAAMPTVVARPGQLRDAVRYVGSRPDTLWPTVLVGVFGMFTANLPVTLAAYAKSVFHSGPSGYGWLSATVAIGSLAGALISAGRRRTTLRTLIAIGAVLSSVEMVSAAVPDEIGFRALLLVIGATTLLLLTSANAMVQTAAHDAIRGRVMGVYLLVFIGSAAIGGPLLGATDQHFGPRVGMLLAGAVPAIATVMVGAKLAHDVRASGVGAGERAVTPAQHGIDHRPMPISGHHAAGAGRSRTPRPRPRAPLRPTKGHIDERERLRPVRRRRAELSPTRCDTSPTAGGTPNTGT